MSEKIIQKDFNYLASILFVRNENGKIQWNLIYA